MIATCASCESIRTPFEPRTRLQPAAQGAPAWLFCGVVDVPVETLPGGLIFAACRPTSWRTRRRTRSWMGCTVFFFKPSNNDVLAFHEEFADIAALFQQFSMPELLRHAIVTTRGAAAAVRAARRTGGPIGSRHRQVRGPRNAIGAFECGKLGSLQGRGSRSTRRPGSHTLNAKLRPSLS
jgi:hypothetical protein